MAEREGGRRRTIQGGLIIFALVALVVLIFVLDDLIEAFTRKYALVAVFPEAADLVVDAPVWLSGKPVGRVQSVELQPVSYDTLGLVSVTILLPRRVRELVRGDSRAYLTSATLIGERVVDISAGTQEFPALGPGDTIPVRLPREFAVLTDRLEAVQAAVDSMLETVDEVRARLAEREALLRPAAQQLERAQAELDALFLRIETGPGMRALRDPQLRASMARIGGTIDAVRGAADRTGADATGTAAELRAGLAQVLARADTLSLRLALLDERLRDPAGFTGRLAQDTALPRAVRASRAELDSLIADARRNPFRFFRLRL